MFSKISRYTKLEDVVAVNRDGHLAVSRAFRLIPDVDGRFLHTVEENDRLDHLAYKYYGQPRKWWRICDANPDYPLPQAVLGKDAMVIEQFPLIINHEHDEPLWSEVLGDLKSLVGVESARLVKEEVDLVERIDTVGSETVTLIVPLFRYTLIVCYNGMNLDSRQLMNRMTGLDLAVGPPERLGRVGKSIVIPPNTVR